MDDWRQESGESWRLPEAARPPLLGDLVERIDEALATARASEAAVMAVGAAALDAAEQAKRAAGLAERASAALSAGPGAPGGRSPASGRRRATAPARAGQGDIDGFTARADQLAERLSRLQRLPLSA
jgi:hypothetical protein